MASPNDGPTQAMDFSGKGPKIGAVIRGKSPATSISYHEDGNHLYVTSESDSKLRLVDCQNGTSDRPAYKFERDGVRLVEKTHHNLCVLYTGIGSKNQLVGQRNAIHYLSLYDNKLLRDFRGHSGEVTDLSMSPVDDSFMSVSTDRTVRMWNLQQAGCLAELELPSSVEGYPHGCFDSTGLVFGVAAEMAASSGHMVHLYDARKYGGGAFAELKLAQSSVEKAIHNQGIDPLKAMELSKVKWTSMNFNTSGKQLLVTAEKGLGLMLDGFDGSVSNVFIAAGKDANVLPSHSLAACFTPDDNTVLVGNEDGTIGCWSAQNGNLQKKLEGHVERVGCIAANPKYAQLASSCTNTALWLW